MRHGVAEIEVAMHDAHQQRNFQAYQNADHRDYEIHQEGEGLRVGEG